MVNQQLASTQKQLDMANLNIQQAAMASKQVNDQQDQQLAKKNQ